MSSRNIAVLFLLIPFLLGTSLKAQIVLKDSVLQAGTQLFRVDDLGNQYFVIKDQSILMIKKGGLRFTFNDKSLGDIANIDVSNPLKILVHYGEANTLLILDNTLSEVGKIALQELGIYGLNVVVGTSRLGGFWVFNPMEYNLVRYGFDRARIAGNQLSRNIIKSTTPLMLLERNGKVFLSFQEGKLLVFDVNAVYLYQFPFPQHGQFQVANNRVFYRHTNHLRILNIETVEQKQVPLPKQLNKDKNQEGRCAVSGNRLYGVLKRKVLIFDIEQI